MIEIIEAVKQVGDIGLIGILSVLVYLLAKDRQRMQGALIECLQSGGHITEKTVDRLDDIG